MKAALAAHGLTHPQFVLLTTIWWLAAEEGDPTQARVAAHAAVDGMTTSQVLRRLETLGLVRRRPDPGDARARRLRLTAAGAELLAAALPAVEAVDAEVFAPLGDRTGELIALLGRLAA